MNKNSAGLIISIVLTLGCTLEEDGGQGGNSSLAPYLPMEFSASLPAGFDEDPSAASVKTMTPDGTKVYWEPGDQIVVFRGADTEEERYQAAVYTSILNSPYPYSVFHRDGEQIPYEETTGRYYAMYPSQSFKRWGSSDNYTCYADLPARQTAVEGGWDKKAGILAASSRNSVFHFEHRVAYLRFDVDAGTSPFVSVDVAQPDLPEVIVNDANFVNAAVANELRINYEDPTKPVQEYQPTGVQLLRNYKLEPYPVSKVELVSPDGGPFSPGTYYVAVFPRTYDNGLAFVFKDQDGKVAVMELPGPFTLNVGDAPHVGKVGHLDFRTPVTNHTIWSDSDGENQGVVFWVNEADPTKAKIVSICNHQKTPWALSPKATGATSNDPVENYNAVAEQGDFNSENYPAAGYCASLRNKCKGNWHLPSIEEIRILYNSYYGRNYISPLSGNYNQRNEQNQVIQTMPGFDFRYHHGNVEDANQTAAEYQRVLASRKKFDDLLKALGEDSPASLDGVSVTGTAGNYSIDPSSLDDSFGSTNGVAYWLAKETKEDGDTKGCNAFYVQIGLYRYANLLKDDIDNNYVRCIKDVSNN